MIDLKLLRDDPDRVRASQRARGEDPGLVDALLAADTTRRAFDDIFTTVAGKADLVTFVVKAGRTPRRAVAPLRCDSMSESTNRHHRSSRLDQPTCSGRS